MSDLSIKLKISPSAPANLAGARVDSTNFNVMANQQSQPARADELALMKRLGNGDEAAMKKLIEKHGNMLAQLVGRLTAWSIDHEDVFQEVLLNIWQKAGKFRGQGPLGGWLRRLAINQCHNQLRQKNSFKRMLTSFFETSLRSRMNEATPRSCVSNEPLQTALAKLPINERTAVVLYYLEDMTGEEVALELGIKPETLHVRLHRARKKLRVFLENECDE